MKRTILLFFIFLSISRTLAQGVPCEKKEEAVFMEMDKESLAMTICDYKSRSDVNRETIRNFDDFSFMDDALLCMEELMKAERVYRTRFGEDPPECGK